MDNRYGWIWLRDLRIEDARVGVYPDEHLRTQPVGVDVGLWLDIATPGASDRLQDTVDWADVVDCVGQVTRVRHYVLVESLCEILAGRLLQRYGIVQRVVVRVHKLTCFATGTASVEVERSR